MFVGLDGGLIGIDLASCKQHRVIRTEPIQEKETSEFCIAANFPLRKNSSAASVCLKTNFRHTRDQTALI